jgi:hypothetical protein
MAKANRTMEGIFLPPATFISQQRGMWYECVVSAGRRANGQAVWAGMNLGYINDFCGGRVLGCVNVGHLTPGAGRNFDYLPLLPEVPKPVQAIFRKYCPYLDDEYMLPLVGMMHAAVATNVYRTGSALLVAFDRVNGSTMARLRAASQVLAGRRLGDWQYGRQGYTARLARVRMGTPYVNYNSGHKVAQLSMRVARYPYKSGALPEPLMQRSIDASGTLSMASGTLSMPFRPTPGEPYFPQ